MTIVNPLVTTNLLVQASSTTGRPEERQNNLRIEQIVQATVVEGGLDRALLELKHQRIQIQTEQELQTGQQLELQVLETHPRLAFKIINSSFDSRFASLLPLLAKPFDWGSLLSHIQQKVPSESGLSKVLGRQLAPLLRPVADLPADQLTSVVVMLGQMRQSKDLFSVANGPALATAFDQVLKVLDRHVEALDLPQKLRVMATQIRQQPELMRQFVATEQERISHLLTRIEQPEHPLQPHQARQLAAELKTLLVTNPAPLPQELTQTTRELTALISRPSPAGLKFSPALLGHLQKMVQELQTAVDSKPAWPQDLQQVVQHVLAVMRPLMAGPENQIQPEKLGLLGQLFGLNLEAELVRGRTRDALHSLKLALLDGREQLGSRGEEALHRIELFQVCRVRLAEQNLFFVPLPFPILEEGFLLVQDEGQQQGQPKEKSDKSRMSVHLRLSALGSLRIDVLTESSGVLLRVACEDSQRADFLKSLSDELQERLHEVPVRGITFTIGVDSPATALIEKIIPATRGMFDARV